MSGDPVLALLVEIDAKLNAFFERTAEKPVTPQADLAARMDRMERRLAIVREDITLNIDRTNRVFDREATTRREVETVSSTLQALARQVQRLRSEVEELKKRPA